VSITNDVFLTIVLACIGSSGLTSLLQFLISRKDKKEEKKEEIMKELKEIKSMCSVQEKDICRTQLLLLISNYPEDTSEIMKLAEHYFKVLKANWYMSSIFNSWLKNNNLTKPEWFDE